MSNQLVSIQDGVGDTLLAWHRFKAGTGSLEQVEHLLNYLATKASVETFGAEGELTTFKPFEHYVIDHTGEEIREVAVVLRGTRAVRNNGSTRIISRALVTTET
jgi:hypothetical protein